MKDYFNDKTDLIYYYFKEINKFENQLEKIYSNYDWNETHNAYIIKFKDYQSFKDNIFYDILKKYNYNEYSCKQKIEEFLESDKINDIKKIDKIIIKTDKELIYLINNNNEYKLISLELGAVICNENNSKRFYIYLIDYPELILNIDINIYVSFSCNNGKLNKDSYITLNEKKLLNIAKSAIEYNNFENKIISNLKNKYNNKKRENGYLVDKNWVDEWKKYINFDKINFGVKNGEEQILDIMKQISYFYNIKKKVKKPKKLELLQFIYRKEMRKYLELNSLVIISYEFYRLVSEAELKNDYQISFNCFDGNIFIYLKHKNKVKEINFNCNNNIIKSKNNSYDIKEAFEVIEGDNEKNSIYIEDIKINKENLKNTNSSINNNIIKLNIKDNFISGPNIGLQNIGATCYMNSTLQCFCHIEKFVNFFKYNPKIKTFNKDDNSKLCISFKILIDKLWPDNYDFFSPKNKNKYYAPEEFKKKISKMNSLFEGIAANDAKDLVNFIILTLHSELNKTNENENQNEINNNLIIDQTNQKLVFNNFAQDFIKKNKSIISDLFYSMNCSVTECLYCHNKLYNYQTYFFIIFPLEEVRKFKNNNNINNANQFNLYNFNIINNMNSNEVNIYDCFDYDKKVNIMCGENALYCNNCKQNYSASMYSYLVTSPEILIILLNRGKGIEFDVKINFYENLNLNNYVEYKDTGYKYKLIGVITHIGESSMSGHFISYCRDPINEKWFKFNDAIVTEVNNFQTEVINFAMPYLLFYQKI